jgi:hypothetical protein
MKVKKLLILSVLTILPVMLFSETISDLMTVADNVSASQYVNNISSLSGITAGSVYGSGGMIFGSLSPSLAATGSVSIQMFKNLDIGFGVSTNQITISATFDPSAYQQQEYVALSEYLSYKVKLKMDVINFFFDAMKVSSTIKYLSGQSTSLKTQTDVALLKAQYIYDMDMVEVLLNTKIKNFDFPPLNVPTLPGTYTQYQQFEVPQQNSDLSFGTLMALSKNPSISLSFTYSWNQQPANNQPDLLDVQKSKYFNDMQILAQSVKSYDNQISALFNEYSSTYSNYLQGKSSISEVNKISKQISDLGYERDQFCIELLREYYLYEAISK